jgi:hypothetical protein
MTDTVRGRVDGLVAPELRAGHHRTVAREKLD